MDEKEIRKILKEETVIPDNIDKAMEDVLKGILDSPDERMSSTKNLIVKSDKGRSKNSGNKKKIIRILLPVAAVLGVSTGVLATKLGWLHKELEQQGVTEQEAVQMVVTEPDSTAENVEDVTSYHITPKERDWNQSMLSVTEAYFDGSGFSFLGDPSGAVENYTLSCRDHATVNGEDALATLNKIDGEDLYYGHITLYDDALTEKILNEDSQVEVSMTIQAYPDYNGRIYYTWKDDEAFRKIFKTGSFTDSEGMLAYALPAEDAYRGYTPPFCSRQISCACSDQAGSFHQCHFQIPVRHIHSGFPAPEAEWHLAGRHILYWCSCAQRALPEKTAARLQAG